MDKKIGVIGGGSFGTALGLLAAANGLDVVLYVREEEIVESINNHHKNSIFLSDVLLPDNITAKNITSLFDTDCHHFIWTIPSQYTRATAKEYSKVLSGKSILIASKGIEIATGKLLLSVMNEEMTAKYSVVSGPSFAKELAQKKPTIVSIASYSSSLAAWWQQVLSTEFFRVYTSDDMIGLEVGGAIKNVIAIATGISDGLGLDNNARAGIITRGLAEITRFGLAYGAKRETFVGLSGLGDLVLTCTGDLSRNHQVGIELASGKNIEDITSNMKMVAEGVPTAKAVYLACNERGIEMPISAEVYRIIYENKSPQDSVRDLMLRPLKNETPY